MMTNVTVAPSGANTDDFRVVEPCEIVAFFSDLIVDPSLDSPLTLGEMREWALDDDEAFELAVILSLGFDDLGWDTPDETEVTFGMLKASMLKLGHDYDLHAAEKLLSDHVRVYEASMRSCGDEPRFLVAKSGYKRLRDEAAANLASVRVQLEKGA